MIRDSDYVQHRVALAAQNHAQPIKRLLPKHPILNSVLKKLYKFIFANYQMYAIVLAIAILAESQAFPSLAVIRDKVAFYARLIVLIPAL